MVAYSDFVLVEEAGLSQNAMVHRNCLQPNGTQLAGALLGNSKF